MISAILSVAIIGITALVLDRGYLLSAPEGIVQVGRPSLVQPLEEIVVSAKR